MHINDIWKQAKDLGIDVESYSKWAEVVDDAIPDFDFEEAHDAFEAGMTPEVYINFVRNRRLSAQGR